MLGCPPALLKLGHVRECFSFLAFFEKKRKEKNPPHLSSPQGYCLYLTIFL